MSFFPSRGSLDTLVTLSGNSLLSVSGVYLTSGSTRGQCSLVSTSTNLITFYPPAVPPGNLRSGLFTIYNLFGSATETNYFTQIQTPKISGINPSSGITGSYFRISGSGARDYTGLWFNDLYTGVLTDPIFENSTWLRSGIIPFFSGGLNAYFSVKVMSEGGSSISPTLYFVREDGISLSGLIGFPTPILAYQFLRGTSTADGLEWQTPSQVLTDITGVLKSGGDDLTGNYRLSGNLTLSGVITRQLQLINDPAPASGANILNNYSGQLYWSGQKVLVHSGVTSHGIITYNPDYPNANVETGAQVSGSRIIAQQLKLDNSSIPFDQTNVFNTISGKLYWSGQLLGLLSGNSEDGVVTYNKDYPNINVETGVKISGQRVELGQIRISNTTTPFDPSNVMSASGGFLMWTGAQVAVLPTPTQPLYYLRENSVGNSLEWRSPTQVREDINAVSKTGDWVTGEYYITGGKLNLTGLNIQNSGIISGDMLFDTISSGAFLVLRARIGGITWIGSTLKYS